MMDGGGLPCTATVPEEDTEPMRLLAIQVYFPISLAFSLLIVNMEKTPKVILKHAKSSY